MFFSSAQLCMFGDFMIFIMHPGRKALPHCSANMPCSNTRIKLTRDIKTDEAQTGVTILKPQCSKAKLV